jgi:hypothetical protein
MALALPDASEKQLMCSTCGVPGKRGNGKEASDDSPWYSTFAGRFSAV